MMHKCGDIGKVNSCKSPDPNDEKCINCNNKSFISNEKSKYWSNKNELKPRNIFKNSN